ncbi:MAG: hypothetical protein JXR84_22340 [Anaerolineae bacterium]|nr:hypothetical protein [Anaerolineae bacterium]
MKTRFTICLCSILMILALALSGCTTAPGDAATAPPAAPTDVPPTTEPVLVEPGTPPESSADWQTYYDNVYGFRLAYPAGWQYKVQEMGGPGMPDDWPVKAIVSFFPAALADVMNHQGPPDPNAPPAVPPFNVEVFAGPMEEFRRAYAEPGLIEEGLVINGASMVVERDTADTEHPYDDFNTVRYVYSHPADPNVRVVLLDVISGFKDRATANPEYIEVIRRVITTLEFTGETPPAGDPLAYQPVTVAETGLTVEVPESWEQRAPEWAWEPFGDQGQRVGVNWVDLQAPQEPEAALLPDNAQILESEEVDLTWSTGRSFTLEVYAPAAEGGDAKAPVAAVEQHLIVVMEQDGGRRAYDFYAVATTAEQLDVVMPVYHHLLGSIGWDTAQENPLDTLRFTIAAKLNADPNTLDLILQAVEFPDACLGLPAEGEVCAQVLTPGYGGEVKVGDKVYEVRASQDGQRVILCDGAECIRN